MNTQDWYPRPLAPFARCLCAEGVREQDVERMVDSVFGNVPMINRARHGQQSYPLVLALDASGRVLVQALWMQRLKMFWDVQRPWKSGLLAPEPEYVAVAGFERRRRRLYPHGPVTYYISADVVWWKAGSVGPTSGLRFQYPHKPGHGARFSDAIPSSYIAERVVEAVVQGAARADYP